MLRCTLGRNQRAEDKAAKVDLQDSISRSVCMAMHRARLITSSSHVGSNLFGAPRLEPSIEESLA